MKRSVENEEFFTADAFAERCVELLMTHVNLADFRTILEPSAGTGAFIRALAPTPVLAFDITPRHPSILEQDFLSWIPDLDAPVLVVGNPPFGQRSSLAIRFIEVSCSFADVVAFILPRSFRKYTFQNRINRSFHLVDQVDGEDFIDPVGNPLTIRTVFQIWKRGDVLREPILPQETHPHFEMKHAHLSRTSPERLAFLKQNFEFAIPQVGAQFRPRSPQSITKGSWWFIAPKVLGVRERFENLDFSFLDNTNIAHKSLSKRDIVQAYLMTLTDQDS